MSDKELEEYINKIKPNFNSHLEKGTIEMSNEYYNLLEEKMVRLINKNQELKSQLAGTTHCFDEEEHEKLKKQLEEYQEELEKADSITQSCIFNGKKESEISYRKCLNMLEKHKNQQKKFIEYLENEIKRLEKTEFYIDSIQKAAIETHKHNLSKYKEIIGDDK